MKGKSLFRGTAVKFNRICPYFSTADFPLGVVFAIEFLHCVLLYGSHITIHYPTVIMQWGERKTLPPGACQNFS